MSHTDIPAAIHGKALDRMMEADAAWFEAHPGCNLRARRMMPFEFNRRNPDPPPGFLDWVVQLQIKPGFRVKQVFMMRDHVRLDECSPQDLLALLYELAPSVAYGWGRLIEATKDDGSAA